MKLHVYRFYDQKGWHCFDKCCLNLSCFMYWPITHITCVCHVSSRQEPLLIMYSNSKVTRDRSLCRLIFQLSLLLQRASFSIMFTRLDAERNGKILKRAVNERRLSDSSFSVIMEHMDNYVSLPAKRLAHIVRRYSHHRAMKNIGKFEVFSLG